MWANALKAVGLAPVEDYIQPRLSIGNRVLDGEFSTGHFKIQVNTQTMLVTVKNLEGRVLWQSIHNEPFLFSSLGQDEFGPSTTLAGVFTPVVEHDTLTTRLQTITKIAYDEQDKKKVNIFGGLGTKLVLPTHMDYKISFQEITPHQLIFSIQVLGCDRSMQQYKRLILIGASRKEEAFYGFGEQYSSFNHKGQKIPILIREQGKGRVSSSATTLWSSTLSLLSGDPLSSNCVVPFYMTNDHRGFYLTNTEYASFDLQHPERVVVRVNATTMTARLLDGDSLLDLITEYTSFTGRVQPMPSWIDQGAITEIQGGPEKVRQIVQRLHHYQVPLAAICISDWTGYHISSSPPSRRDSTTNINNKRIYTLEHDAHTYPDWISLVHELTQRTTGATSSAATLMVSSNDGDDDDRQQPKDDIPPVRVLVNISPLLSERKGTDISELFDHAKQYNYLVKTTDGLPFMISTQPGNAAAMIDLSNPEARQWLKGEIKKHIFDTGLSGYMADYGNTLPMISNQIQLFSEQDAASYHNQYADDWAALHMELLKEYDLDDNNAVYFVRSGFTRSPGKIQGLWTGDQNVTWDQHDGIKSAVTAMLNAGMSGFSVSHCDIGGYVTADGGIPGTRMIRNRELLYRWMELAAFTPVFRTSEGSIPFVNAQFYDNEESYLHLAHTTRLFTALATYRNQLLKEAQTKGWPVMRHLILYYPDDDKVQQLTWQQFLLGSAVMVAPTLSPSSYVKVYFPRDNRNISWRHLWTGKLYEADGSYQAIDTPMGQPAAFVMEPRYDEPGGRLLDPLLKFASSYYATLHPADDTQGGRI
ncbi:glycosyl hydrolases family 31-domain-containing protein [Halteromyces radiatus]|uniref:glycosyl hydrolases family 31-domain-containing protein n=1 Tax=Halteromyces radiatus TaxID=101107 RepID=UPI00221ED710|nr:glycosyl hydrolases family 31-domain-containing protein [Halteromyces radiatus]KAI8099350.1 glycosyl hydrolases family 31-domain-containing protein [Halteromyces radiatus]